MNAPIARVRFWAALTVLVVGLAGCGGAGNTPDGASPTAPTASPSETTASPAPSTATPTPEPTTQSPRPTSDTGFRFRCYASDGRLLGDWQRLEEVWASSNYLRTEYCEAIYAGPLPWELTLTEAAVAEIAAGGSDDAGEAGDLYLEVLSACTRLGADEGEHSIEGTPAPILEATLTLCPEAPQARLISRWLDDQA